jgi:hypothetical protein
MTARALLLPIPQQPAKRLAPAQLIVEGVVWLRSSLGDGSYGYQGFCPTCRHRLMTGFLRVQPSAVQCTCGRWVRLP